MTSEWCSQQWHSSMWVRNRRSTLISANKMNPLYANEVNHIQRVLVLIVFAKEMKGFSTSAYKPLFKSAVVFLVIIWSIWEQLDYWHYLYSAHILLFPAIFCRYLAPILGSFKWKFWVNSVQEHNYYSGKYNPRVLLHGSWCKTSQKSSQMRPQQFVSRSPSWV